MKKVVFNANNLATTLLRGLKTDLAVKKTSHTDHILLGRFQGAL